MLDSLAEVSFREVHGTSLLESGRIPLDLFPGGESLHTRPLLHTVTTSSCPVKTRNEVSHTDGTEFNFFLFF